MTSVVGRKIAIVTPWYGEALKGGAEQQAWQLANRLAERNCEVEVLTTCCASFQDDWSINHHLGGVTVEQNITVRRFEVDGRDATAFDAVNEELLANRSLLPGVAPTSEQGNETWRDQNINSGQLEKYLEESGGLYDAFIFLPYLYGVILRGLPLVADKAWLQPCLHDEAYAYLPCVSELFYRAKGYLFISEGEQRVGAKLFGPVVYSRGKVVGAGVEPSDSVELKPIEALCEPFVLSLGRRSEEKGVNQLVNEFLRYKKEYPDSSLMLVLAGPGDRNYTIADSVLDLELVSEHEKSYLLKRCIALCNPSSNESFSRVIFEAWSVEKPVLVNAACVATAVAVKNADGGWLLGSRWMDQIRTLELAGEPERSRLGRNGRAYGERVADWDTVITQYEECLFNSAVFTVDLGDAEICQVLPNLNYGDAISDQAIQLHQWLKEGGVTSRILVEACDPRVANYCETIDESDIRHDECLLYHHSIGSDLSKLVAEHQGGKAMIYHNITPPEFFERQRPEFARLLRSGREEMWNLAKKFPVCVADSEYNAKELEIFGFRPSLFPLSVDPGHWDQPADPVLMKKLQDGQFNIVFVGRIAPNKRQTDLVAMFNELSRLNTRVRLVLVGSAAESDPYLMELRRMIESSGQGEKILLTGHATQSQLHAIYQTAGVFVCMSEHEGFGVPLLEAMWFDVPVVARSFAAVSETMAGAGIVVDAKCSPRELAGLVNRLASERELVDAIVAGQRERRQRNLPAEMVPKFKKLLHLLVDKQHDLSSA